MSVEDCDVIDLIGFEESTGCIIMTISDHLDWGDNYCHLMKLQEKLNAYIAFFESGEIYNVYPESRNGNIIVDIVFKHTPTQECCDFLIQTRAIMENISLGLRWVVFKSA